jgi:hypothetical protein
VGVANLFVEMETITELRASLDLLLSVRTGKIIRLRTVADFRRDLLVLPIECMPGE